METALSVRVVVKAARVARVLKATVLGHILAEVGGGVLACPVGMKDKLRPYLRFFTAFSIAAMARFRSKGRINAQLTTCIEQMSSTLH